MPDISKPMFNADPTSKFSEFNKYRANPSESVVFSHVWQTNVKKVPQWV